MMAWTATVDFMDALVNRITSQPNSIFVLLCSAHILYCTPFVTNCHFMNLLFAVFSLSDECIDPRCRAYAFIEKTGWAADCVPFLLEMECEASGGYV